MIFSGHQPNFLPYMGFFYKMFQSDVFVLDDDVQYSSKGLHNKNYIYSNGQKTEIIVPVKHEFGDRINDVRILYNNNWKRKMLRSFQCSYSKAPYFGEVYDMLHYHIMEDYEFLCSLNYNLIMDIAERLGIEACVKIASEDLPTDLKKNERNVFQCKKLHCNIYYSGIGGKEYNDERLFEENGIKILYSDYLPTPYRQHGAKGRPFLANLSIVDYLFNKGFEIPEEWKKLRL